MMQRFLIESDSISRLWGVPGTRQTRWNHPLIHANSMWTAQRALHELRNLQLKAHGEGDEPIDHLPLVSLSNLQITAVQHSFAKGSGNSG